MNEIQKFLQDTTEVKVHTFSDGEKWSSQPTRPWIYCKDGEGVSIQASEGSYCSPRINGANNYYEIEAGFPSVVPPMSWKGYAEEWEVPAWESIKSVWRQVIKPFVKDERPFWKRTLFRIYWKQLWNPAPTQTIYAWMPVKIAQEFIDAHGGIDWDKTFAPKDN